MAGCPSTSPDLAELVETNREVGRLTFTADPAAISQAEVVFVAVGTHDGNGGWQTRTIQSCLNDIVPRLADDAALVVRSTLPPWFLAHLPVIVGRMRQEAGLGEVPVLLNPEFTKEGTAVQDFLRAGARRARHRPRRRWSGSCQARRLYRGMRAPILEMSATDAALSKLGANLFLATKISFANELAQLCDQYGGNVDGFGAMAYDHRHRRRVPARRDRLRRLVPAAPGHDDRRDRGRGRDPDAAFAAVAEVNLRQRERMIDRLAQLLGGSVTGARIALLGVTFKPDTDDLRDAPSIHIATRLIEEGATVVAFDPMTDRPRALCRARARRPRGVLGGRRPRRRGCGRPRDRMGSLPPARLDGRRQPDAAGDHGRRAQCAVHGRARRRRFRLRVVRPRDPRSGRRAGTGRGRRSHRVVDRTGGRARVAAHRHPATENSPVERQGSGASGLDLALTD